MITGDHFTIAVTRIGERGMIFVGAGNDVVFVAPLTNGTNSHAYLPNDFIDIEILTAQWFGKSSKCRS
jgi:hypothetical protein